MNYKLTKSKYIKGLQCEKALYLDAYKRYLGVISAETQQKFEDGRSFEATFKNTFVHGVAVDKKCGRQMAKCVSFTQEALAQTGEVVLFEAGFMYDEVLVLTDVLQKRSDGLVTIYEIKNSTKLTEVIKADLSVQYYVCQSLIPNLQSFKVVLNDGEDGFTIVEMIEEVKNNLDIVREHIVHEKEVLQNEVEPSVEMGSQCTNPYPCEFREYCAQNKTIKQVDTVDGIKLDPDNQEFNYAADFVQHTNKPIIYLTGKAGTGKTTFLKYLRATTNKKMVVLAPTGVAAVNAGGQTIHSFFQIAPSVYVPDDKRLRPFAAQGDPDRGSIRDYFKYGKNKLQIIRNMELLVIDEISMVRCDLLDVIDSLLRFFRRRGDVPFGGVQVLLIGDTFQLPPIAQNDEWDILKNYYSGVFFFNAQVMEHHSPIYIELKKIYRQKEQDFIDMLNHVRVNRMSNEEYLMLNAKYNPAFAPSEDENYIILATTNRVVESYNATKLAKIPSELQEYAGTITGDFTESNLPTDQILHLKVGAQVMLRKNNIPTYYNGTIGKIVKLDKQEIEVEIDKKGEKVVLKIEKAVWNNIRFSWNDELHKIEEEIIGTFTQFPLKLAWAITVHKSQGLTFEKVIADVGTAFAAGQVYVALSRCTSMNGLVLKTKIGSRAIMTDRSVLAFAEKETPNTLIVSELKSGKADFYYQKARAAIQQGNFEEGFDELLQALRYRDDLEKPEFKRYFVAMASRLFAYKRDYENHKNAATQKEKEELQQQLTQSQALTQKLGEQVRQQNNGLQLLLETLHQLEADEAKHKEEIDILKYENAEKDKQLQALQNEDSSTKPTEPKKSGKKKRISDKG